MCDLGDDPEFVEALHRIDGLEGPVDAARDHVRVAQKTIADCIDACMSMYLGDDGPIGRAFHNFSQQLVEAEKCLSRAEGELAQ